MVSATANGQAAAHAIATNVRRLMARHGLTYGDVVEATGLDERTIRGLVRGVNKPHARTLHKLAGGLGVSVDELFRPSPPASSAERSFDRATNPLVDSVVRDHQSIFLAWSDADFDELYSHFGTGGALTEAGVLSAAEAINHKRSLLRQVSVLLESGEADLLADFVKMLYRRVTVASVDSNGIEACVENAV
jgi:transcriptional regulator with XRE-family HTH domain